MQAWSPDGLQIAFRTQFYKEDNSLYVINADGSNLQLVSGEVDVDWFFSWSPDSNRISFTSGEGIYIVNTDGTNLKLLTNDPADSMLWTPSGKDIIYTIHGDELHRINVDDGSKELLHEGVGSLDVYSYNASSCKNKILLRTIGEVFSEDVLLDLDTFSLTKLDDLYDYWEFALSPDCKYYLISSHNELNDPEEPIFSIINLSDASDRTIIRPEIEDGEGIAHPTFSYDGKYIAFMIMVHPLDVKVGVIEVTGDIQYVLIDDSTGEPFWVPHVYMTLTERLSWHP
jgi:Tol biopolymer transport system component